MSEQDAPFEFQDFNKSLSKKERNFENGEVSCSEEE